MLYFKTYQFITYFALCSFWVFRYNIEQEKKLASETTVLMEEYTVSNMNYWVACFDRFVYITQNAIVAFLLKHRHAKRAGVIFSIDWATWGKTGC